MNQFEKSERNSSPFERSQAKLDEAKADMQSIIDLIESGKPVQNETHGIRVDNIVGKLREAASDLDDVDDSQAAVLRESAVEIRNFSRNLTLNMRRDEEFNAKDEFMKVADKILNLQSVSSIENPS